MAYKINFNGHEVICDTAEELVSLIGADATSSGRKSKKAEKKIPKTPRNAKGWAKSLATEQKALVTVLAKAHPAELSDADIRRELAIEDNRKLAGLMGGLVKAAKRSNLPFDSLIHKDARRNGSGERHYCYGIAPDAIIDVKQGLGLDS